MKNIVARDYILQRAVNLVSGIARASQSRLEGADL